MEYISFYKSFIAITSDGEYLTGLWFLNENLNDLKDNYIEKELKIFDETKRWLDIYFSKTSPNFTPKYKIKNITKFRKKVIDIMNTIPFGKTITYNDIAKQIAKDYGINKMSAQAVGNAVGSNPISIIIPCHRVVGTNGNLTGYQGGLKNKIMLLENEDLDISKFYIPKKVTKL